MGATSDAPDFEAVALLAFISSGLIFGALYIVRALFTYAPSSSRLVIALFLIVGIPLVAIGLAVFWFEGLGERIFATRESLEITSSVYAVSFAALWFIVLAKAGQIFFAAMRETPSVFVGAAAVIFPAAAWLAADFFFQMPIVDLICPNEGAR